MHLCAYSIVEPIRVEVARARIGAAAVIVAQRPIGIHLEPIVAEGETQALADSIASCAVLHRLVGRRLINVTHSICHARLGVGVDAETLVAESGIEVEAGTSIPVSIDVHGLSDTPARFLVILGTVADAVARSIELQAGGVGALALLDTFAVIGA